MLSRQQMLQILNTMDDSSLSSALSAVGIESGTEDEGMDSMFAPSAEGMDGDELQSWNARDVSVPPPNKPAFLVDKSQFIKGAQPQAEQQYMDQGMLEPDAGPSDMDYMPLD